MKQALKKKVISLLFALFVLSGLCSCEKNKLYDETKPLVVCTNFSAYDWVRQVAGENISQICIKYLGEKGVDMHSYQPSAEDIALIKSCDLLIYTGGESEEWVEDVLREDANPQMIVINMLEVVGEQALLEEELPGLEESGHNHEEEEEFDEHVWLSLENAKLIVRKICDALTDIDASNGETYKKNSVTYEDALDELNNAYCDTAENAKNKTLVFGDRFPFGYLVHDYGLNYYAAFAGCSAETEASFETITFLAGRLDGLGLDYIIVLEDSDKRLAETINKSTESKQKNILEMDSIQSVSADEIEAGYTYIKAMENNLTVLKQALY